MYLLIVLVIISKLSLIVADPCSKFVTCGQCIGNNNKCTWCPDEKHAQPRCASSPVLNGSTKKKWCSTPINPLTEPLKVIRGEKLRPKSSTQASVQLEPQHIVIKARPGDKVRFNLYYKPAADYPIDIYYLFDNSYTMREHKAKLKDQAHQIHDALKKLSNNVRFGAGSFIEKLALPYANEAAGHKLNTFNNHVSLTEVISEFVKIVENVHYSGNYDPPESGLDAMMQAMVCDEIGWREARRMIIYSTDAVYHSAGDGKMVGAYKPNDMKCHLEITTGDAYTSHTYAKNLSLLYDYPSVSQINKIARDKNIMIYFTALKVVEKEYRALAERVGAKFVEINTAKSNNDLVNLIREEYVKLLQSVEIDPGHVPTHLDLKLSPACKKGDSLCQIKHGESLTITGTVHVKTCPSNGKYNDTIIIKPVGLGEHLRIDVVALCQCDCEKKGNGVLNSPMCNSTGTYQCGICDCNKNRYGKTCQCAGISTEERDSQLCKAAANDTKECSGTGDCICGKCTCWEGYDGDQCQYRTNDCPTSEGKVCGNHGTCKKSKCECKEGWKGNDCTCSTDNNTCVGANSQICSGHGVCKCGACECTARDPSNKLYRGTFCDSCDTCVDDRCKQLEDYVECNFNGDKLVTSQLTCDTKFDVKSKRTVLFKNQTEITEWEEANWCYKVLKDQSSIVFKYLDGNNSTVIWIQKEKELPPETNIWIPIGSALGAILLIGILTVIAWKILVDIHDRREYRKFMDDSKAAGFDVHCENPHYQPPATFVNNPAYNEER